MNRRHPYRWKKRSLAVALVAMLSMGAAATMSAAAEATPDRVKQAQEAFTRLGNFPWYDTEKDGLRPVTVDAVPDRTPSSWSWNWSFPTGFGEIIRFLTWSLFAALLAWIIYKLCQVYLRRETSQATWVTNETELADDSIQIDALPLPAQDSWNDLLDRARQYFEQGKYREAMIFLFSHQLVELNRQQIIHLSKGKTNRQYLREVRRQSTLAPLFERSIETFELAFFGNQSLSREQFESVWRDQPAFQQQLSSLEAT